MPAKPRRQGCRRSRTAGAGWSGPFGSQPEEDFAFVEEVTKPEGECEAADGNDCVAHPVMDVRIEKGVNVASGKSLAELHPATAAHEVAGEINGDGVHPHPNEGATPGR